MSRLNYRDIPLRRPHLTRGPSPLVAMIIASNLLVSPIQNTAYLASLAVINGANSLGAVIKFVKSALLGIMKISWTTSPVALVVAQKFLAPETWVPFFSFISFVLGTSSCLLHAIPEYERS